MNFVTFNCNGGNNVGLLLNDVVIPLKDKSGAAITSMIALINSFDSCNIDIKQLLVDKIDCLSLSEVKLLAPIPYPLRNIFCLGKNYVEHAREIKMTRISDTGIPEQPIYFTKIAAPAIGDQDHINICRQTTKQVDYEVELAVIIGKDGVNIKAEDAQDYIFGYTIVNDVSARDLQGERKQWFKGKSLDTFCPMGPCIVQKEDIPWPVELDIQCRINGELRQNSNTRNMIFDIPYIVSDLSKSLTLKAGDIICTGTPSGVGMGFDPPQLLEDGDIIECYIEKIGKLVNRIVVTE